MKVKLGQAVKMFFGNSSLEMVFFEAIANALDADATQIDISIYISALNKPESLLVTIADNGVGFTDERYKKFSNLFDVDESSHKGLGRLVYLCYFDDIRVSSHFRGTKKREFAFSEQFDEQKFTVSTVKRMPTGTVLNMSGYLLQKIAKSEYLQPVKLKNRILEEFYSRLLQLKNDKQPFAINLTSKIEGRTLTASLTKEDIPPFTTVEMDSSVALFEKFFLRYSIREVDPKDTALIAAISVDNRTLQVDLIAEENIPLGYKMVFLLFSDYFTGKVDIARQNLTLTKAELKDIQTLFRKEVARIIEENIPKIKKRNKETREDLLTTYPHLTGYFDSDNVGYIARVEILKKAQDEFFKAQRELLDAQDLSEEDFQKSLDISARALTEYILFRQLTIRSLKSITHANSEAELHKLFAAMGKDGKFEKKNATKDLYRNNSWLLDDKYMTYETVLSNREMGEVIQFITSEETPRDNDRPDIALIFSNNPKENKPFDIVVVELKKKGLSVEENMVVITQLEKRARRLMQHYNNQIQRIWYYGIIEFNEEIELQLSGQFVELYSSGKMYYREIPVTISLNPKLTVPIGVFIWDLDAVIGDAETRNAAFLNLIKSRFAEK